jgi:type I restriction enzyme R subunit
MKTYEADMRHLIDNYIQADDPETISPFGDMSLLDIITKLGIAGAIENLPTGIKRNEQAVAETIENNVRKKIIREHLLDPAFFDDMSTLLAAIIKERRDNAISYEEYLKRIAKLVSQVNEGRADDTPDVIKTFAQKALYNNLGKNPELALLVDVAIRNSKRDGFRGNLAKEREIKFAIYNTLKRHSQGGDTVNLGDPPVPYGIEETVERIFKIIIEQKEY